MEDRLAFIRTAPTLVETVVRVAVRETVAARRAFARTLDVRDVANVAVAELDRRLARSRTQLDGVARAELAAATVRAATAFAQSRVARRLGRIPVARFLDAPAGADVALVDRHGAPHLLRIEAYGDDAERVARARAMGIAFAETSTALRAPDIHFFSLRDGKLRSFAAPAARVAREARPQRADRTHRAA